MRTRYRYDADLDCLVEVGGNANFFEEKGQAPNVISDDLGAGVDGLRIMHRLDKARTDSKSVMRRDAKAHGLEEVGTETNFASKRERPNAGYYVQQVKDAADQIRGNYQGTADRLARENEQRRR